MNLESKLEAVLFYVSEPVQITRLASILDVSADEIRIAVDNLAQTLLSRGVSLVRTEDTVALMTHPLASELIEKIRKDELKRDIGKAGAETLAIIAYNGNVTRGEIDFIRGVNSTFILRNLLVRGLIERIPNPNDARTFVYRPTVALFAHLGITHKEQLPQFADIRSAIQAYAEEQGITHETS